MRVPTTRERNALRQITYAYEDRERLGGAKTFQALIDEGWIEPYEGTNLNGDRYQITEAGRIARATQPPPKLPTRKLKALPSRLREIKPRLR